MKWARLLDGRKFEIVKMPLFINGKSVFIPTNEQAEAFNIKPFLDEWPVETGYTFAPLDTATERDSVLYRDYERRELPPPTPPVIRYSGWAMYKAIKAEGFGDAFDALMKADIGVMIAFVRPQYFLSNDADFVAMVTQMCAALHIDDAAKERILAASVDEEVAA